MTEATIVVANFRRRLDAEMASNLLAGHGIPFVIRSAEAAGLGPIAGGTDLLVRPSDADRALAVLTDAGAIESDSP